MDTVFKLIGFGNTISTLLSADISTAKIVWPFLITYLEPYITNNQYIGIFQEATQFLSQDHNSELWKTIFRNMVSIPDKISHLANKTRQPAPNSFDRNVYFKSLVTQLSFIILDQQSSSSSIHLLTYSIETLSKLGFSGLFYFRN
jgi:hypothetical protein